GHFHSEPRAGEHRLSDYPAADPEAAALEDEPEFGRETLADELTVWVYFLLFIGAVLLFGFVLSVPVLVATYLWREAGVRPPYAALSGLICAAAMYLMFEWLLRFQLHPGFLTGDLLKSIGL